MGIFLFFLGGLITLVCFLSAIGVAPSSAPQQAVQELRYIEAMLGLLVMSAGGAIHQLGVIAAQVAKLRAEATTRAAKDEPLLLTREAALAAAAATESATRA